MINPSFLPNIPESGRSRLHRALKVVAQWSDAEREFFIRSFTSRGTEQQLADEMGMSLDDYNDRRRQLMRRFRQAAQPSLITEN